MAPLARLLAEWRGWRAFKALPRGERRFVFYSEGPGYWTHLEPVVRSLTEEFGQPVAYLTSGRNDPLLAAPPPGLTPFYVGDGSVRTMLFAGLQAGVVVMTMPDLQTFHIKRSPHVGRYAYIHHSIVSQHMIYRPAAFDHFDAIFCVGPHHVEETRAREAQLGLKPKQLVEHGYGRLDALIAAADSQPAGARQPGAAPQVLIAPSWGPDALLERCGGDFIAPLLAAGFHVILRPHPHTRRRHPRLLDGIAARHGGDPRFTLEENVGSQRSLLTADLMVSDWSGAALEFAFARLRPVLFVDVPRKVNNPDYASLGIEALEAHIREKIGRILPENEIGCMAEAVDALLRQEDAFRDAIGRARGHHVYHVGRSGAVGARELIRLAGSLP